MSLRPEQDATRTTDYPSRMAVTKPSNLAIQTLTTIHEYVLKNGYVCRQNIKATVTCGGFLTAITSTYFIGTTEVDRFKFIDVVENGDFV